jgi:hypothetical protein
MAFLDNSGDIILDAVLTDAGRQRLSRGNFKITKFALGDEEINYSVFNGSHPSGSAFYDLEIMQTPVLEAFTNNTSLMKSKLITMTRNNILYMPVFKLNDYTENYTATCASGLNFDNGYIVLADRNTELHGSSSAAPFSLRDGVLRGATADNEGRDETRHIALDQGIDSSEGGISFKQPIPDDLVETAFLIKMDHRLLTLSAIDQAQGSTTSLTNQFVDDDGIATYYVVEGDGSTCVEGAPASQRRGNVVTDSRVRGDFINDPNNEYTAETAFERFEGPLGSILRIYPKTSLHVRQSSALFDELGTADTSLQIAKGGDKTIESYKFIDTIINVVGVTTGYSFDIPIRIVKMS